MASKRDNHVSRLRPREPFEKLRTARSVVKDHRTETGHKTMWELYRLA